MFLFLFPRICMECHVLGVRRPGTDFKTAGGTVVRHSHQPLHLRPIETVALEGTHSPAVAEHALAVRCR